MLKNPWSHVRWRGNYSELDALHWTEELKKALNYDPESAASFDNRVVWIDYDSLCKFFEVVTHITEIFEKIASILPFLST
jgi:calpain-7